MVFFSQQVSVTVFFVIALLFLIQTFSISQSDLDFDLDLTGQTGFFCGSPPVRSNNPLVRDAQFINQIHSQSPIVLSPLGADLPGKKHTGSPSYKSTYNNSPQVRIEGFNCRKSVPSLA
jgi:hypothetical protein